MRQNLIIPTSPFNMFWDLGWDKLRGGPAVVNVSVVIPAYNAGRFLADAIASAINHLGCPLSSILVVDDGSSDDSFEIARRLGVRSVRHPSNRGVASALNTGIALADTEYVAWLSADDLYAPGAGIAIERAMTHNAGADLYFGQSRKISFDGKILGDLIPSMGLDDSWNRGGLLEVDYFIDLVFGCFINGSTTIMRRERILELGLFDTKWNYVQDYAMWLLMSYHRSTAVFVKEVIGFRRLHEGQLGRGRIRRREARLELRELLRSFTEQPDFLPRLRDRLSSLKNAPECRRLLMKQCLSCGVTNTALGLICPRSSFSPIIGKVLELLSLLFALKHYVIDDRKEERIQSDS